MLLICPKCGKEFSVNILRDAIDEQGEVYRCKHCNWPFFYDRKQEKRMQP